MPSNKPTDPCEVNPGVRDKDGYAISRYLGRKTPAHRAVWQKAHGPLAPDIVVRHICDNPPCVNLNHLIVGTQQQNIQDAMERGRWMTSKRIAGNIKRRKLSDTDVETIRSLRAQGWTNTALASKYAVNQSTISRIVSNLRRVSERV